MRAMIGTAMAGPRRSPAWRWWWRSSSPRRARHLPEAPPWPPARHMHQSVDLGRVAFAAAGAAARRDRIDQYLLPGADFSGEAARRDRLLARHEPVIALLLDRLGDRRSEIVGDRATHRL